MTALAVDLRDANTVFAGSSGGGVWKTTDGGMNWSPLTDHAPSLSIGSLAIDPSNPDTVYAGTGFIEYGGLQTYYGAGILKSTDAGVTWTHLPGPFSQPVDSLRGGASIISLAVNPADGRILYAGLGGGGGLPSGVYRSADGGSTWQNVLRGGIGTAFVTESRTGNVVYAALSFDLATPTASRRTGIFKSLDSGVTWIPLVGLGANALPSVDLGLVSMSISQVDPSVVVVSIASTAIGPADDLLGVYKTIDGGQTWSRIQNMPNFCGEFPLPPPGQCYRRNVIRMSPADPRLLYVGGRANLYRSKDGGDSWTKVASSNSDIWADVNALAFSHDGSVLYVADDAGVSRTIEAGGEPPLRWENLNRTLATTASWPGFSIHPSDPRFTFGSPQEGGLLRYAGDTQWQGVACGDGAASVIDPVNPNIVYASCQPEIGGMYKTMSGGFPTDSWKLAQAGIDYADRMGSWSRPLAIDTFHPNILYFGTYRVYQTADAAASWKPISGDLAGGQAVLSAISVAPGNSDTVYVGSTSGRMAVSFNATFGQGATWVDRSAGLPPRPIAQIAVNPSNPLEAYVAVAGFSGFGGDSKGHLFKTTSAGQSWVDVSGNLPNSPVNAVVIDPANSTVVYVGTDTGVFTNPRGAGSWVVVGSGLPSARVNDLKLHQPSRILRAATFGRGMWDLPVPVIPAIDRGKRQKIKAAANAKSGRQ